MDLTSYLLGKNSSGGGGGDLSEYFNSEITSNTDTNNYLSINKIVKKLPPFTISENVTDLSYCFRYFPNYELDLSQLDTKNVTNISSMFANSELEKIDISNFNTLNIQNASRPFNTCTNLKELICNDLKYYANTVSYSSLFNGLFKLAKLDISKLDTTRADMPFNFGSMFTNCGSNCLQSDGAYADGIPYVYVKDTAAQTWVLTANNGHPDTWTTANVVIKQ